MNAESAPFQMEGPQPLIRETAPGLAYPVAALGALRPAVEAVAGQTLAPIAIPAASALAVASLAVQGFADVETLAGFRPTSVFLLTVAQSGERKSTCDGLLLSELRAFERAAHDAQRGAVASWQNAHALWKGERESILGEARKTKGKDRAAQEADLRALGREPIAPPMPDRTVSEPTFEGLTRKLSEGMPTLGLLSDEGGQFLGGHAMSADHKQKTLAAFNKLWDGAPIQRTRAGDGSSVLYGRRVSIHLMAQPGVVRSFLGDPMAADIGFSARFLICEPPSTIGTRLQSRARPDALSLARWGDRLRHILETSLPMDQETRALDPRRLPLSPRARELLVAFADEVELRQAAGGDLSHVTGAASKAAENAARLAGVVSLWADLAAPDVGPDEMDQGIELARFYLSEAARLADAATVSPEIERAERLRKWIVAEWKHPDITVRDVLQNGPGRALREAPAARAALGLLEKLGWLVPLAPGSFVRGHNRKEAWLVIRG